MSYAVMRFSLEREPSLPMSNNKWLIWCEVLLCVAVWGVYMQITKAYVTCGKSGSLSDV